MVASVRRRYEVLYSIASLLKFELWMTSCAQSMTSLSSRIPRGANCRRTALTTRKSWSEVTPKLRIEDCGEAAKAINLRVLIYGASSRRLWRTTTGSDTLYHKSILQPLYQHLSLLDHKRNINLANSIMSDFEDDEIEVDAPAVQSAIQFSSNNTSKGKRSAANLPVELEDTLPWCVQNENITGYGLYLVKGRKVSTRHISRCFRPSRHHCDSQ